MNTRISHPVTSEQRLSSFFNKKARELNYDDFSHFLDCHDYKEKELLLIEWVTEYIQYVNKL